MCWNHGDGGLVLEKGEMWVFYRTQCSICKDLNVLPTLLNHFNILWPAEKLDNILSHLAVNENYNLFHYANPGMKQLSGWLVSQEYFIYSSALTHLACKNFLLLPSQRVELSLHSALMCCHTAACRSRGASGPCPVCDVHNVKCWRGALCLFSGWSCQLQS